MTNGIANTTELSKTTDGIDTQCHRIIDHTQTQSTVSDDAKQWYSLNDNVMGGRSTGIVTLNDNHVHFHGSINTNGGGFASIRYDISDIDLSGVTSIRLSVKSDARAYGVQLQDDRSRQQSISYRAPMAITNSDNYDVIEVPLESFKPTFRGRRVQTDPFNAEIANNIGIILSDAIDGPFSLNLRWIEACRIRQ